MAANVERNLIASALSVCQSELTVEPSYRKDVTMYRHEGAVYCAPSGWRRPPAKWLWKFHGYAKGRPVFVRIGKREATLGERYAWDAMNEDHSHIGEANGL